MSAHYLHNALKGKVLYSEVKGYDMLLVTIAVRSFFVYIPYNHYNGTADIVETARERGAQVVVCSSKIPITEVAKMHGRRLGIPIHTIREFLSLIENGGSPI